MASAFKGSDALGAAAEGAVAVSFNNQLFGLDDLLPSGPGEATAVSRETPEGCRVHKRSVAFVFAAAAERTGQKSVVVDAALGASLHCRVGGASTSAAGTTADAILTAMRQLIDESQPIERVVLPIGEARAHFAAQCGNAGHTSALLAASTETHVRCHRCNLTAGGGGGGEFLALDNGPLLPSTAGIEAASFDLEALPGSGGEGRQRFLLHHAVPTPGGGFALRRTGEPVLSAAYDERQAWSAALGLGTVAAVNEAVALDPKRLVQVSEANHDRQVVEIAGRIAGNGVAVGDRPRLVLIAGPTSSGKTTFAKRLCVALETLGAKPAVVSVDSYYKSWKDIDARGMQHVDWEALESLNLSLLNDHLLALLDGKEVKVPEYDMKVSEPMDEAHWVPMRLGQPGGVVIMEGIHCLNPTLTSRVAAKDKFRIAISPLSSLVLDDLTLVSSSHVRQLRRMVRDFLNRGRSAVGTLKQWPGVARGERANIFPHQNEADAVFNSGLAYEAHALKVYAEPLLRSVGPDLPEYAEARRLLAVLESLVAMPATLVPPQSLLREFIGGSWFYDYAGWYKTA